MSHPTRRRVLAGGAAALAVAAASPSVTQPGSRSELRVGVVVPSTSGLTVIPASVNDYIGDAARQGALLAESSVGEIAAANGIRLTLLNANAPNASAVDRAGRRLVATGGVDALVGGLGDGQAEVLSQVAETAQIPFFNIGSPSLSLRARCRLFTFHVEASAAMYLDAMVISGTERGFRRWFIIYPGNGEGEATQRRAVAAVSRYGDGGEVVGAAPTTPLQPVFFAEFEAARAADADVIMVLLSEVDQIAFVAQQQNTVEFLPTVLFPYANTQTRDYIAAMREYAPDTNPDIRLALWDTTLSEGSAGVLNESYVTRWGDPTDPPAWAAYHAVKILLEASLAVGIGNGNAIIDHLEQGTTFDLAKGPGTSFRSWDHQLRQPLYLVRVDQDAVWDRNVPSTRIGVAHSAGVIPDQIAANAVERLDLLGDGPDAFSCRS